MSASSFESEKAAARITAFATLGVLGVTQDVAHTCLDSMEGADPDLVAEETLCLISTATARTLEATLSADQRLAAAVAPVVVEIPYTYREYLVGGAVIAQEAPELVDANRDVIRRLERKQAFYSVHFPPGQFPGSHALKDKMVLWMGRISPPGLMDYPEDRLERLKVVQTVLTHLRLARAYGASVLRGDQPEERER